MKVSYIPEDLLHIILAYDGRIKYKNGKYVNIIHKNDERYDIVVPIIRKKMEIMKRTQIDASGFYFEFGFDICLDVGLCYRFTSNTNRFEICYYDTRNNGWKQIRTYL